VYITLLILPGIEVLGETVCRYLAPQKGKKASSSTQVAGPAWTCSYGGFCKKVTNGPGTIRGGPVDNPGIDLQGVQHFANSTRK
jgi:hypothetical protein